MNTSPSLVADDVYAILHHPREFASRSGLFPLVEAVGATPVFYDESWRVLQRRSWTLGQWVRQFGNWYYGSTWNSLIPCWDERKLLRQLPEQSRVLHFLWGEFARPKRRGAFHRRAGAVVGTYHASARRLPSVLAGCRSFDFFDAITLMSESQRDFFLSRGVPEDRLRVILHGVDTTYYAPAPRSARDPGQPLRGLLVGSTERDHAFMAEILRKLPAGILEMTILTAYDQRVLNYQDVPQASFPKFLTDEQLRTTYQQADLLVMPMLDCTANNAILESMACGTPVLTNRVGGIPEYVDPACNRILEGKNVAEWVDVLCELARRRDQLENMRAATRASVLRFDWREVAPRYHEVYEAATRLGRSRT